MRIALVHDWLNSLGGAERVLIELHNIFPEAPIYTIFANQNFIEEYLPEAEVRTSFLAKMPFVSRLYKYLFFLMPVAVESFDLSDFDVVISSSAIFSKGLVLKPKTRHICYCYSPTRQLWDLHQVAHSTQHKWIQRVFKHFLRIWDRQAADRVDEFVAISKHVQNRIKKYYRRDSVVVYPPCGLNHVTHSTQQKKIDNPVMCSMLCDYFLIVSRLFPHKNIDVAIEAFAKLGLPLVIIGSGPEYGKIKNQISKVKNIKLLGFVPDEELSQYYANCKVFIMPQEEDFGLTPIEAMSYGKPVLALRKGGAIETVIEGVTGEFFDDPIPEALADGIRRLNENYDQYDPETIKKQASKFSSEKFKESILNLVT